jgi:hypothetical protein
MLGRIVHTSRTRSCGPRPFVEERGKGMGWAQLSGRNAETGRSWISRHPRDMPHSGQDRYCAPESKTQPRPSATNRRQGPTYTSHRIQLAPGEARIQHEAIERFDKGKRLSRVSGPNTMWRGWIQGNVRLPARSCLGSGSSLVVTRPAYLNLCSESFSLNPSLQLR